MEWFRAVRGWSSLRVAASCRLHHPFKMLLQRGADPHQSAIFSFLHIHVHACTIARVGRRVRRQQAKSPAGAETTCEGGHCGGGVVAAVVRVCLRAWLQHRNPLVFPGVSSEWWFHGGMLLAITHSVQSQAGFGAMNQSNRMHLATCASRRHSSLLHLRPLCVGGEGEGGAPLC